MTANEPTDAQLAAYLAERLGWLAYFEAWMAGYAAGGGDRNATTDLIDRAHADYQARTEAGQ